MNPLNHEQDAIVIAPVYLSTSNQTATGNYDTRTAGGSYATIAVAISSEANTNATGPDISILHSDDTVVTNFVTLTANRTDEDITNAKLIKYSVDLRGKKRYLRLSVTSGSNATNDRITVSATGRIAHMGVGPSSTTRSVASTNDAAVTIG